MKTKIGVLLGIVLISFVLFSFGNHTPTKETKLDENHSVNDLSDRYRVTARTRNAYRDNYWIDLVVEGNVSSYSRQIYNVYYDDGYGLTSISHSSDYSHEDTYYVYIDSEKYYFTF